ncbi:MAG: hypothetical protein H6738_22880 [Alphaproteobacteria bacterium]|nr:hypothetical protein [Alphaproteobacteria bacterium]MCB9699648.1 hypothetical protein [Alphaproteobacteria bacterium]
MSLGYRLRNLDDAADTALAAAQRGPRQFHVALWILYPMIGEERTTAWLSDLVDVLVAALPSLADCSVAMLALCRVAMSTTNDTVRERAVCRLRSALDDDATDTRYVEPQIRMALAFVGA